VSKYSTKLSGLGEEAAGVHNRRVEVRHHRTIWADVKRDWRLYALLVLPIAYFVIFRYLPMAGNIIAFRRFVPGGSMFGEQWVGLRYIRMFIEDPTFWQVFRNTVVLGGLSLLFTFPIPIVLALLLNELRGQRFKKFVQTVSYLPHFISVVIVAGMILQLVSLHGTINQVLLATTGRTVNFIHEAGLDAVLGSVVDEAGLTGSYARIDGVEATRRYKDGQRYLFLLNHGDREVRVAADVTGTELLTGVRVEAGEKLVLPATGVVVLRSDDV
jgi:hypothetical protein